MQDNKKNLFKNLLRKHKIVTEKTVTSATLFITQRERFSNTIKSILLASFQKVKATT